MTGADAGMIGSLLPGAMPQPGSAAGAHGERASEAALDAADQNADAYATPTPDTAVRVPGERSPIWLYALAALLALLFAWRIIAVNLSAHFQQQAIEDTNAQPGAIASAVAWDRDNADALARAAALRMDADPAAATVLAQRALRANPATASAYLVLASIATTAGDTAAAIANFRRAAELEPQNPSTRLALANLALADRDLPAALDNIDAALRSRPELSTPLFPKILAITAQPEGNAGLRKLFARRIPEWWPAFFNYASTTATSPLLPLQLLDARRTVAPDPSLAERGPLIERLATAGEWNAAFVVWLNGLTPEQRRAAGNVFNGTFEAPFTNSTFDWQWPRANGADIAALSTFGTGGGRALRVAFQGQVSNPRLVTQTLLLQPGYQYDLRGRFRLESVRTQFGLQWEMSCAGSASAADNKLPLAATDRLVGTSDWKEFTTTFSIPDGCYPQQLALVLRGDAKLDLQATGLAWYDEIQVVRGSATTANVTQKQPAKTANVVAESSTNTTPAEQLQRQDAQPSQRRSKR